mmetsp:Transcript_98984/g.284459  ORF Transcript_98984/g.284459 Transcript_98984/m.284459 type:complete len:299 (+) Transcript_98984:1164-2060(+)
MQNRATPAHLTRRLNILLLRAMRSSDWSVSTPRDVATSSACSRAVCEEPRMLDMREEHIGTALNMSASPADPWLLLSSVSAVSSSTSSSSSMAAASSRSAASRKRSSLSSAPSAARFIGASAFAELSWPMSRSRSRAANALTNSSGSSTSPPSASRAAVAASEPHHDEPMAISNSSRGEDSVESETLELNVKSAALAGEAVATAAVEPSTSSNSVGLGDDVPTSAPVPTTNAAMASLMRSASLSCIRCAVRLANRPCTARATSASTPSGSGACGSSQIFRTSASWFPASKGRRRAATS